MKIDNLAIAFFLHCLFIFGCNRSQEVQVDDEHADSDSSSETHSNTGTDSNTGTIEESGTDNIIECSSDEGNSERLLALKERIQTEVPCFNGRASVHTGSATAYTRDLDFTKYCGCFSIPEKNIHTQLVEEILAEELNACGTLDFSSTGELTNEFNQIRSLLLSNCLGEDEPMPDLDILVDSNGVVSNILAPDGLVNATGEFIQCANKELGSHLFECFSNMTIYHSYACFW